MEFDRELTYESVVKALRDNGFECYDEPQENGVNVLKYLKMSETEKIIKKLLEDEETKQMIKKLLDQ